jgi:CRP-like cAMP-binding protein
MDDLKKFGKIGKYRLYQPGDVLFLQGAEGDCMYIANKGTFGVYINSFTDFPAKVAELPVGAYFGEMSVIDGSPRSATIVSEEKGAAVAVDKEHFKTLLEENPDIAVKILETLCGRYENTSKMAAEKGKTVEVMPEEMKNPQDKPPETYYDSMIYLAGKVRELNELLNPARKQSVIELKTTVEAVTLLPKGHKRFSEVDDNTNPRIFSNTTCVCPYCGKEFKAKTPIFGQLALLRKTKDYREIYSNLNILAYTNLVCPNCNYCDSYQEFQKELRGFSKLKATGNRFVNAEGFTGYANEVTHTMDEVILSYYLCLECLKQIPGSELRMGKTWQKLFWIYGDLGDKGWEAHAAMRALENFQLFMLHDCDSLATDEFMTLNIIMGEINCQINRKVEAMDCFEKNTNISGYQGHELATSSVRRYREIRGEVEGG